MLPVLSSAAHATSAVLLALLPALPAAGAVPAVTVLLGAASLMGPAPVPPWLAATVLPTPSVVLAQGTGGALSRLGQGGGDLEPLGAAGAAGRVVGGLDHAHLARDRYDWPTGGPAQVLEGFDPPAVAWGRGHRGVDLAAPEGAQVLSAGNGVVTFAGTVAGRPVVSVDHADGVRTTYEPVEPTVSAGQAVTRGQVIGTLLAGHRGDGNPALHWGARTGPKVYVNPLRLLRPAVIRLKPLSPG